MSYNYFRRGTTAYDEVVRILGGQANCVADESVRQINNRWLKGSFFVWEEGKGFPHAKLKPCGTGIVTVNRRIRIPKDSFLAKRKAS